MNHKPIKSRLSQTLSSVIEKRKIIKVLNDDLVNFDLSRYSRSDSETSYETDIINRTNDLVEEERQLKSDVNVKSLRKPRKALKFKVIDLTDRTEIKQEQKDFEDLENNSFQDLLHGSQDELDMDPALKLLQVSSHFILVLSSCDDKCKCKVMIEFSFILKMMLGQCIIDV